eukprot:Skav201632  [mRNA]  locus=scaffold3582:183802:197624:- [translate_table: standard]
MVSTSAVLPSHRSQHFAFDDLSACSRWSSIEYLSAARTNFRDASGKNVAAENPLLPVEEVLPCDDDMSDEAGSRVEAREEVAQDAGSRTAPALATPRRRSVATKVADCKARLAELQAIKTQKLEEEDYMGAHEAKQMIVEQEKMLQAGVSQGKAFTLPNDTFDRLYGYQREGVAWMAQLMSRQQGGVLADEMGLGKTIQVCALLNGARKAGKTHALLLMPVTLLEQWSREAKSWCPGWPVYTYYGTVAQRAKALRGIRRPMGGLLLTSYSLGINCEELLQVRVEDVPEPARRRGRPPGSQPSKRRKLDDDDGEGEAVESEEASKKVGFVKKFSEPIDRGSVRGAKARVQLDFVV